MMGYQGCVDWCHNHPALLAILLILSTIFPVILCVSVRKTTHLTDSTPFSQTYLTIDIEKQTLPQESEIHHPEYRSWPAWSKFLALLRTSPRNQQADTNDEDGEDIEPQEKTPLIGSIGGDQAWRTGGQLANSWHGTNQLNTSWGYMA